MGRKKLKSNIKTGLIMGIIVLTAALTAGAITLGKEYKYRFSAATRIEGNLKIYPGMTLSDVAEELAKMDIIKDAKQMKKYAAKHKIEAVKTGNYDIAKGSSYRTILTTFANGRQTPIRLTFNNFRTIESLMEAVGKRTLANYVDLIKPMQDKDFLKEKELTPANVMCIFIPNTYEIYWTATPEEFFNKMYKEYEKFWSTKDRSKKAKKLGFTPIEISIIASIVTAETNKTDEMSDVAGVYINRLRKNMMLQADPTVKFALQDFEIRRLLNRHLTVDSPYNTYKYKGIPPGPICMASIAAIDATLNYSGHEYLYFCAKSDFSGYHAFAKNHAEHSRNAKAYQNELNRMNIK